MSYGAFTENLWVSPIHRATELSPEATIDEKIAIFVDRTLGWQLEVAEDCLKKVSNADFAVLQIVFSYFEMIAKYEDGRTENGASQHYFKKGVLSVFPHLQNEPGLDDMLRALYEQGRCGLYHGGMTGQGIIVGSGTDVAININRYTMKLVINPYLLPGALKAHLRAYESRLRDANNTELRAGFERRFDAEYRRKFLPVVAQCGTARRPV